MFLSQYVKVENGAIVNKPQLEKKNILCPVTFYFRLIFLDMRADIFYFVPRDKIKYFRPRGKIENVVFGDK